MSDTTKTNMIYETETSCSVLDMNFEVELKNNTRKKYSRHKLVYCPVYYHPEKRKKMKSNKL